MKKNLPRAIIGFAAFVVVCVLSALSLTAIFAQFRGQTGRVYNAEFTDVSGLAKGDFVRIAVVADTETPTPPCGACRQILWEFGGNLAVVLANLGRTTQRLRMSDLLPLAFDARFLDEVDRSGRG